jgi:hypothetical protein
MEDQTAPAPASFTVAAVNDDIVSMKEMIDSGLRQRIADVMNSQPEENTAENAE